MKRIFAAAAAAAVSTFVATPAFAQDFFGPRVGVELGIVDDDFLGSEDVSYGINAGYDIDLGTTVLGVTGSYSGRFDDDFDVRELGIGARAGFKVAAPTLVYGSVGYSNLDADNVPGSLDGVKLGLGVEQSFGNVYAQLETRYGDYDLGVELYQTVIGVGYRF